ncbi:phospholipase D-like domain-containing protein [Bradyrhizobium sp. Arg816]|uniref:phospholipase D-like domain-containing protein n=1 Tax=Bradyrhizobium sp. Arg816 TaxID=2998491 RepID=UPI00249DA841|nr:phospholipase D-like domain-containing protein [Bradyrhizobium sp. Arg816]MDI3561127.1 phospholipase D-like domain-containing protein [Bradyrhizobium sp. Arg816]
MPELLSDRRFDTLVGELYPLATQAARIIGHFADSAEAIGRSDRDLASRLGGVSAEHVAIVRRSLIENGLAARSSFATRLVSDSSVLFALAERFKGVAAYLRVHRDQDVVRLVLTEPGLKSALRRAIDGAQALPPIVFQTTDAFFNLARGAKQELVILSPFLDAQGADLLVELFSLCRPEVRRVLISRPLAEAHCGDAFRPRAADFRRLNVSVVEYALPSSLPSGRETFHAKVVLADDSEFYVGSSNFMGSALERSFECGVFVRGETAKRMRSVLLAVRAVGVPVVNY